MDGRGAIEERALPGVPKQPGRGRRLCLQAVARSWSATRMASDAGAARLPRSMLRLRLADVAPLSLDDTTTSALT